MGARHTAPIVEVFEQRFAKTFNTLAEGGRTTALWVEYHWMIDVIKIFIKSERLADHDSYLPVLLQECWRSSQLQDIINMLRVRPYQYYRLMKQLECLPSYKEAFESLSTNGNHVVRYSSHD